LGLLVLVGFLEPVIGTFAGTCGCEQPVNFGQQVAIARAG
jgi:hypothetical protein